jgi:hypothetical protein
VARTLKVVTWVGILMFCAASQSTTKSGVLAAAQRAGGTPNTYQQGRNVVVNGVPLETDVVIALERAYRVPVQNGRYWYDRRSGVWGLEGGPGLGQIQPGLMLGGPMRADASRGNTGVFVNGRQLHMLDVLALRRCTVVIPGRYWVEANGIGGYEDGPPMFNLAQMCAPARSGSSTQTECFSNGCQSTNSNTGIGAITDGQGHGMVFLPGGGSVSTPN